MASSAMVAGIQRVGEKVRALSGSTNFGRPNLLQSISSSNQQQSSNSASQPAESQMSQSLMIPQTIEEKVNQQQQMSTSEHQYINQAIN